MSIGIAVVGYGSAGKQNVEAIQMASGMHLVGILEINQNIDTGSHYRFENWEELLNNKNVAAVSLCIPPGGKANVAVQAMQHEKAVLLEKPPCTSEKELEYLINTSVKTGQTIGVMFQHRYQIPSIFYNKSWGAETVAVLEVSRPRDFNRYFQSWRQVPSSAGGGILSHLGVHYLDLACSLLGNPISIIQLGRRDYLPGIDIRVNSLVEFTNNAVLTVAVTGEASKRNERLRIYSKHSTFTIENGLVETEENGQTICIEPLSTPLLRIKLYEDFSFSISQRKQPSICNLERCRGVIKVIENLMLKSGKEK